MRAAATPVFAAGTTLGPHWRYRIERPLGRGGFGEAYLAYDIQLDRPCVVKRLILDPTWSPEDRQRVLRNFQREARLLATLNTPGHPNIPEIYDYLAESHSLVIKYISGQSLGRLLDQQAGPLPVDQALRYVRDICSALVYMHTRTPEPVLHKDIKPDNILLDPAGRIWLIDFGLARTTPVLAPSIAVEDTQIAGTLGFTPPEQWRGAAEPRSDVYALGATLHMLLTNHQPGRSERAAMMQGLGAGLPPARQFNPAVSPAAERLIQRALAFTVADRPTAQEFLDELEAMLARPAIPPPPEPRRPPAVTAFVGRQAELAYFADRLATEHLAVVTGLAGVGKTTLASMLVERVGVPARTFWHTFHKNEGVDAVIWELAAFLARQGRDDLWRMVHSSRQGGQTPPELLFDYLLQMIRGQRYLLCFDDFHFVDDAQLDQLTRRLHAAGQTGEVSLIIISRHVPAWVQPGEFAPLAGLGEADVRRLLADRGVALADDLVAELAARTEGNAQFLTLAIEALRRAGDPAGLVAQLAGADSIEHYLLAEVDAGLSPDERALMGAVAVLQGYSGTRDAIEAILKRSGLRRPLSALSQRHLLNAREGEAGRQYGQHAIMQAFYYDQLSRRERQMLHRRAGKYYETAEPDALKAATHFVRAGEHTRAAALATTDVWAIINVGQARALRLLLEQLPDNQFDPPLRTAICTARGEVYSLLGESGPARGSYVAALASLAALPDSPATREQRARACRGMAETLQYESPDEALEWLQRGLQHVQGSGGLEEAALYLREGSILLDKEQYEEASHVLEQSLRMLPEEAVASRASALLKLGNIYFYKDDLEQAQKCYRSALEIQQQTGDIRGIIGARHNLGLVTELGGDWLRAADEYVEALELAGRVGSMSHQVELELSLGILQTKRGDLNTASIHLSRCLDLARGNNLQVHLIYAQSSLADLYICQAAWELADAALDDAERLSLELNKRDQLPEIYRNRALVRLAYGEGKLALADAEQAIHLARDMGLDVEEGASLRVLGQALLTMARRAEALAAFKRSFVLLDAKDPYEAARTAFQWGRALKAGRNAGQSWRLLQQARATFQQLGARLDLADLDALVTSGG